LTNGDKNNTVLLSCSGQGDIETNILNGSMYYGIFVNLHRNRA